MSAAKRLAFHVSDERPERWPGFRVVQVRGSDYWVRAGYRLEDCPGEAHRNAHIDNCSRCAPLWGVIVTPDD